MPFGFTAFREAMRIKGAVTPRDISLHGRGRRSLGKGKAISPTGQINAGSPVLNSGRRLRAQDLRETADGSIAVDAAAPAQGRPSATGGLLRCIDYRAPRDDPVHDH